MSTKIMLDLETLGTKPGSVIVAIGATKFDLDGVKADPFYSRVCPESCVKAGLQIDTSTIMWWLTQKDEARLEITKPGKQLSEALSIFSLWVGQEGDVEVWGNGASFDNALLSAAYDAIGQKRPWKYAGDRCYRTVKNLYPHITLIRKGEHHNALDDAITQTEHLIEILKTIIK